MAKRNAAQARQESLKNLKEQVINKFIEHIDRRIEIAVGQGKCIIYHPFSSVEDMPKNPPFPSADEQEATLKHFTDEGYTVKYYPDPDLGHPGSSDYYTIEW